MVFRLRRKLPPSPIQIPKFNERRESKENDRTPLAESPLLPITTNIAVSTSLATRFSFNKSAAIRTESSRTVNAVLTTTIVPTPNESPTKTTFITVTQSIRSPKEKGLESPDPTQTVFISASAQVVTVTVPTILAVPTADIRPPPNPQTEGNTAVSRGALVPVSILSAIAGIAIVVTLAIILWRRKKRRMKAEKLKQRAMAQRDSGGFRAIPDTQPIIS